MNVADFLKACADNGYDTAEGECPTGKHRGQAGWFVRAPALEREGAEPFLVHLTREAIEKQDWETLDRGIKAGRDVVHFTRIVGYLSRVDNWNPSKIGELRDRRRGRYAIEEASVNSGATP